MTPFWQELLTTLSSTAIILTAVAWLVRSILTHYLSKDIESYKIGLKANADILAYKHQVRFSRLHDKRASVIAKLYSTIVDTAQSAASFVSPLELTGQPSQDERFKKATENIHELNNYFARNRIYLSENLCRNIEQFIQKIDGLTYDFSVHLEVRPEDSEGMMEKRKVWIKSWNEIKNDVPPIKQALEGEFRAILGVENE